MLIELWITTWRAPLTAMIAGWGASWHDAAELAQDTLVEGYLQRERFVGDPEDPSASGPWLRGIARNLYRSRRRKLRPEAWQGLDGQASVMAAAPGGAVVGTVAGTPQETPEDSRIERMRAAMAALPEKLRVVLYMRYLEDNAPAEIALLLGITERAVEGRLRRARNEVRRALSLRTNATQEDPHATR